MKKLIYFLIYIPLIFVGCKSNNSGEQEVQKLLERQTVLKDSQEESLEKLQQIKDSLANQRKLLMQERDQKDERSKLLEQNQRILIEELKKEEQSDISTKKTGLEGQISAYKDSIQLLRNEITSLNVDIDSIGNNLNLYAMQEGQAENILESGIEEIDQRITKIENQKQQEMKKADLLKRRSAVAEKKIEAYQLERQMYVDERDDLLRLNASEDQLKPYPERIAELDSILESEGANKQTILNELDQTNQWISEVDDMISDLQTKIKQEYDRKNIIEGFISTEKQRLQREIANLQSSRERMIREQEQIALILAGVEQQIATLDKRIELIKNKDMSEILEQQARAEQSDADLAEEEIRLFEESGELNNQPLSISSDTSNEEIKTLVSLSNQFDMLRASIKQEQAEITKTRMELSEKRAEVAEKRARAGSAIAVTAIIIVAGGLVVLITFNYLGKKVRQS